MITMLLCGIGLGIGLWCLAVWAFPPKPSLHSVLASVVSAIAPKPAPAESDLPYRIGHALVPPLAALGLPNERLRRDLAVIERGLERHFADKAILAAAGCLLPTVVNGILVVSSAAAPWMVPAVTGTALGAMGFLAPDWRVRRDAERRRATVRHGLSAYLNLLRVLLAGGAGIDGALSDAATVGRGFAFTRLRQALTTAKFTRTTPWACLGRLGAELDVRELTELASSITLAGIEGARIRASLAAKATAIRTKEMAEAEADAQAATERMSVPVVLLFAGFLLFISYPALAAVLAGF